MEGLIKYLDAKQIAKDYGFMGDENSFFDISYDYGDVFYDREDRDGFVITIHEIQEHKNVIDHQLGPYEDWELVELFIDHYITDEFKNNKEAVLKEIKEDCFVLMYASDNLRNDKDVVLTAVQYDGFTLEYASYELKNDKDVVLAAVQYDGFTLEYASDKLKNDKEIVLTAVNDQGDALEYASEDLKGDKDVVLAAVKGNGYALHYASDELRDDVNIVAAAIQTRPKAIKYASYRLQNMGHDEILKAAREAESPLPSREDVLSGKVNMDAFFSADEKSQAGERKEVPEHTKATKGHEEI